MITFKENTFVKGTYDELMEMAKAIEEKGAKVEYGGNEKSNHLWYDNATRNMWEFSNSLSFCCDHELTKSQLYEAYGIVDFSILNETDVFYVEFINGEKWLYQGENPLNFCKRKSVDLLVKHTYSGDSGCLESRKNRYKLIRLATPQEIEPYKEHFKLNNMETRPIQISQETATRWYNGEDNELKQLAIQTFPELDEATPKVGDLCLFSDHEEELNNNIGQTGEFDGYSFNGSFKRKYGCTWRYCKKIKSIEFY